MPGTRTATARLVSTSAVATTASPSPLGSKSSSCEPGGRSAAASACSLRSASARRQMRRQFCASGVVAYAAWASCTAAASRRRLTASRTPAGTPSRPAGPARPVGLGGRAAPPESAPPTRRPRPAGCSGGGGAAETSLRQRLPQPPRRSPGRRRPAAPRLRSSSSASREQRRRPADRRRESGQRLASWAATAGPDRSDRHAAATRPGALASSCTDSQRRGQRGQRDAATPSASPSAPIRPPAAVAARGRTRRSRRRSSRDIQPGRRPDPGRRPHAAAGSPAQAGDQRRDGTGIDTGQRVGGQPADPCHRLRPRSPGTAAASAPA